jgi:hypothetical protein
MEVPPEAPSVREIRGGSVWWEGRLEGDGGRGRKDEKSGVKFEVVPGWMGGVKVIALMVLLSSWL